MLIRWEPKFASFWIVAGTATYPLYLLHQNIGYVIINRTSPLVGNFAALMLALISTIGLTFVVSLWLEPKLRRNLRTWIDAIIAKLQNDNRQLFPKAGSKAAQQLGS